MNTGVHVSFLTMIFSRYTSRIGIAGSCDSSIFHLLRNLHTVLYNPFFKGTANYSGKEDNANALQYSCLENPMDQGAW